MFININSCLLYRLLKNSSPEYVCSATVSINKHNIVILGMKDLSMLDGIEVINDLKILNVFVESCSLLNQTNETNI